MTMTANPEFWDGIAEEYSRKPVENPEAFDRKIEHTLALMGPDDVVLDVGCGTGSLALRLATSAKEIHGLDVSREMIRIARGKADSQGVRNVHFHEGDIESFQAFSPGTLDGILAYSLLHLVGDLDATLEKMYRMLKPGGFFVASTVCLSDTWIPYRPLIWAMQLVGKAPYVNFLEREYLEDRLVRAGFEDIRFPDVGAEQTTGFSLARKPAFP